MGARVARAIGVSWPLVRRWWKGPERRPYFCVVTPIFDPALDAARLLAQALTGQSFTDWLQILVSNGPSPAVAAWAATLGDRRIRHLALPAVATPDPVALLLEIGRRREHVLQSVDAERYVFWDADLRLAGPTVLRDLRRAARTRPEATIVARTSWFGQELPIPPCDRAGTIDLANLCVPRELARRVSYPLGQRVVVGAGATVIDGIRVGDDVVLGAGAVATRDLLEAGTYVGIPARRLGSRPP
jgi:hypothetical protein